MRRLLAFGLVALVVAVLLPATPAQAAYPGRNGRLVFYRAGAGFDGEIMTVRPNGFDELQLTATPDILDQGPVWSPDGTRLAFRRHGPGVGGLWYMNADGTGLAQVPGTDDGSFPSWSPDGTRLAYNCYVGPPHDIDICVINLDGTGLVHVTSSIAHDNGPVWSPDGTRLLFSRVLPANNGAKLMVVDVTTQQETNVTAAVAGRWDNYPDWSPDGTSIAFVRYLPGTGHGGAVYTMKVNGKVATLVIAPPVAANSHCTTPVWSPDGRRIAYTYTEDEDAYSYIYTIRSNGTDNKQVTFGPHVDKFPDWQPAS